MSRPFGRLTPGYYANIVRYGNQVSPFLRHFPDQALTLTVGYIIARLRRDRPDIMSGLSISLLHLVGVSGERLLGITDYTTQCDWTIQHPKRNHRYSGVVKTQ
jgi:hypothetical protein